MIRTRPRLRNRGAALPGPGTLTHLRILPYDERIRLLIPPSSPQRMAPLSSHWEPQGLGAATVPTLSLMPERDDVCGADDPPGLARQVLDAPDRYLLVVQGASHTGLMDREYTPFLRHYETAFFGLYLQGNEEYAAYPTPAAVAAAGDATLEVGAE